MLFLCEVQLLYNVRLQQMIEQLQMILGGIFEVLCSSLDQPLFEYLNQLILVYTIRKGYSQVPLEFLYRAS